ncbi:hypothetical protein [Caulobacter phage Cr30]|uniref:hypothetical protein n=1 Tax=Caulobacter phage Cr30 TaxID=1357714 RepID=UPI0004A9BAEA|nr:hypothetical protein OZ74_gp155 [Caulobacter phage Cr30]AGS81040.1 hypothetical protein [Caulobacter phage Cr30]
MFTQKEWEEYQFLKMAIQHVIEEGSGTKRYSSGNDYVIVGRERFMELIILEEKIKNI